MMAIFTSLEPARCYVKLFLTTPKNPSSYPTAGCTGKRVPPPVEPELFREDSLAHDLSNDLRSSGISRATAKQGSHVLVVDWDVPNCPSNLKK